MALNPDDSPGFLLWHVTLRWQRDMAAALAPLNLTHVQFVLLASTWWLNTHGEHPSQVAVAQQAGTDVKMTSQVLRTLEAKGLITREVDAADTRARRIRVTDAGADLAVEAVAAVEAADAAFFRATSDLQALTSMLHALTQQGALVHESGLCCAISSHSGQDARSATTAAQDSDCPGQGVRGGGERQPHVVYQGAVRREPLAGGDQQAVRLGAMGKLLTGQPVYPKPQ
jgi:DNA-binding MarR family transcriptional regulator